MSAKRVGFVGVGTMGQPMARNLLKAGFAVTVCPHVNRARVEALQAEGAQVVPYCSYAAAWMRRNPACLDLPLGGGRQ